MRQDELTKESEKCHHGLFFGTTCNHCILELLARNVALEEAARIADDNCDGAVCVSIPHKIRALMRPV